MNMKCLFVAHDTICGYMFCLSFHFDELMKRVECKKKSQRSILSDFIFMWKIITFSLGERD